MTSILNGQGFGQSKESLKAAIVNAISQAMAEAGVNGDHMNSTTVIVDGYEFDGENFNVKARVSVIDHDLEQQEIYHEKDAELQERLEHSEDINNAFFASANGFDQGSIDQQDQAIDQSMEDILSNEEGIAPAVDNIDSAPQDNFQFMASAEVHDQLAQEIPPSPQPEVTSAPASPAPEPSGGGVQSDQSDKVA